jgi:diacylglycerol kinase (ATP)
MTRSFSTARARAVFIVNRNAGRFRKDPKLLARIARAVGSHGDVIPTGTLQELDEAARSALHATGPVVLCGGDGTYLASVTALARAAQGKPLPPIVLARGGTVSIVAKNWGGHRDIERLVRRVVERPDTLRFAPRPTLAVDDTGGLTRVGFTFGTGLVANFFAEYEAGGARGNRAAFTIALRTFLESLNGGPLAAKILTPLPCRITADGRTLDASAFSLVIASVLRNVGLHFLVTYRAGEDPARPHLVASPLSPRALAPQWLRVARGLPLRGEGNFDGLVESFRVDFTDATGPYVLDGDTFHTSSVTVRGGPMIRVAT